MIRPGASHGNPARAEANPTRHRVRWGALALIAVVSFLHAAAVSAVSLATGSALAMLAMLALPALVTAVCLPPARTHGWHRWATLWTLVFLVVPYTASSVLVSGQTWILYRFSGGAVFATQRPQNKLMNGAWSR